MIERCEKCGKPFMDKSEVNRHKMYEHSVPVSPFEENKEGAVMYESISPQRKENGNRNNSHPEDLLNSQVEEFNKGNISFLMTLYENGACFASKPGQVVKDLERIRQSLQSFIDMRGKLKARVKRVLQASDLALLITEWSINGTEPDGKPINLTGRGTVVLRRQSDGTWLMVIENPWGTD